MDEVAPLLIAAPRDSQIRLVTLVTKQDLWWDQRHAARDHYTAVSGPYEQSVAKIAAARGQHFGHTCLSMAIEQLNLKTAAGELLATTAAGYDDPTQSANVDKFIRHLYEVCGVRS